jgi:deoxyribodipyrimidine photo-lyase
MKQKLILYWSRRDFRLTDNPALTAAHEHSRREGVPLLPIFILEDYMVEGNPKHQFGYPSRWFLARAIPRFASRFEKFACVRGKAARYMSELSTHYALTVYVNDDVYPDFKTQVEKLEKVGVAVQVVEDALTVSKDTRTGEGRLYSVFTPFKKSVWHSFVSKKPLPKIDPKEIMYPDSEVLLTLPRRIECTEAAISEIFSKSRMVRVGTHDIDLHTYHELPELDAWYVDEEMATDRFRAYLEDGSLDAYNEKRDSLEGDVFVHGGVRGEGYTSRMSLALAWGLVSPRILVALIQEHSGETFDNPFSDRVSQGALTYLSELIWREFYRYLLFHMPHLMHTEFQERFRGTIEWVEDSVALERFTSWIKGETGYPAVDAAMKQIAATGWMHNRARMIVASVLTKNLGVDWRWGQEYFRAALIDLDEASNNGGWQWGASVGADPKPIRIFNPELQAKTHDASHAYRDRWLGVNAEVLVSPTVPIVDHKVAREEALRRYGLRNVAPREF